LRALLDVVVVGGGVVWEFLVGGLVGGGGLPEKGSVDDEVLKEISKLMDSIYFLRNWRCDGG
jgi:hypothetical protein